MFRVRVRDWVLQEANGGTHKVRSTRGCVCTFVCVCVRANRLKKSTGGQLDCWCFLACVKMLWLCVRTQA